MPVLDDIVAGVRLDLARRQATTPLAELRARLADVPPPPATRCRPSASPAPA